MKTHSPKSITVAAFALILTTTTTALAATPSFSLAWSKYPFLTVS